MISVLIITSVFFLLAIGPLPSAATSSAPRQTGRGTMLLLSFAFLVSLAAAVRVAMRGPLDTTFAKTSWPITVSFGIFVDAVSVTMMLLISFIGLIIARYSQSYLRGDESHGRFFHWMSFTIGATLLMVVSRNLVMFTAAWMMSSFGLHQLLTYYAKRTWAIWAARKKFLISRLGDLMLIMALVVTYRTFGTFEYSDLFKAADAIREGSPSIGTSVSWISLLLVLGAMTKSAQFPFHSWLPDTLESPTPVSALMQAGVINAGGFLMIRLSPLVTLSPSAMNLLTVIGTMTALMGSVIMLTQPSIKRSLAYSTIAQMGFMMLQCGLGAFSAALLHIVAHSSYKAHAYLSCGSVLERAAETDVPVAAPVSFVQSFLALLAAISISTGIVCGILLTNLTPASTHIVLEVTLILAITQLTWQGFVSGRKAMLSRSVAQSVVVAVAYVASYRIFATFTTDHMPRPAVSGVSMDGLVVALVVTGFVGALLLQLLISQAPRRRWVRSLYVHAMNGFYIDIPARRLTALIYRQVAPVQ